MTATTKRYLETKDIAKMIRNDLKAEFPATKFSVRTDSYAGGSSINIKWTDGPSTKAVDEVVGRYEGRGFDGMIDMAYSIDAWMLNGKIIGSRCAGTVGSRGSVSPWGMIPPHDDAEIVGLSGSFVSTVRKISPSFARPLIAQIANYWGGVTYTPEVTDGYDGYKMVDDADYYRHIRPDVDLEWRDAIHRASGDASLYAREAR